MTTKLNKAVARGRKRQSGTVLIEFALSALLLFPIMIGVVTLGLSLGRNVHVAQLARDAGSMFVRAIDFSATSNQDELVRLADGMGMTRTGGNGVVIFSKVTFNPAINCVGILNCNSDKYVVVQRLVVGNTALYSSQIGPSGTYTTDSRGNVNSPMTTPGAVSTNFSTIMTLAANESAYVTETFFPSLDLTTLGTPAGSGVYARAVF